MPIDLKYVFKTVNSSIRSSLLQKDLDYTLHGVSLAQIKDLCEIFIRCEISIRLAIPYVLLMRM